ncbi:hypothetical protein CPER28S_02958 [Cellulomonas persica]
MHDRGVVVVESCLDHVLVEQPGPDRGANHPRRDGGGHQYHGQGDQEPGREPDSAAGARRGGHAPTPMRYPTPRTVRTKRWSLAVSPSF